MSGHIIAGFALAQFRVFLPVKTQLGHQRCSPGPATRTPPGIHVDHRPAQRHTTGIDLDKATAGLERQFAPRFEHDFHATAQVNLLTRFNELPGADLDG
ncbi:hypothetical protein J2X84_003304 [Pseudomonas corrugata]|nr:hypothetical protein [Pseudomonas corrugata]